VIVHLALSGGEAGSDDERARLMKLQDEVSAAVDAAGVGLFDGDEWGVLASSRSSVEVMPATPTRRKSA
jgi:hypothetical protein